MLLNFKEFVVDVWVMVVGYGVMFWVFFDEEEVWYWLLVI